MKIILSERMVGGLYDHTDVKICFRQGYPIEVFTQTSEPWIRITNPMFRMNSLYRAIVPKSFKLEGSKESTMNIDHGVLRPMNEAPTDEPILAYCVQGDTNLEIDEETGKLSTYDAHREGLSAAPTGLHVLEWGGGWTGSWEEGGGSTPDWWFVSGSDFEVVANPLWWIPIPPEMLALLKAKDE